MKVKTIFCWFLCVLCCLPALSFADKVTATTATSVLAAKVIIGLTLVVILIVAFAWFAKKLGYFSFSTQQCQMKIVGTLPLGTREKAVVIEAAGKLMLLGVTPGSVNKLYTFSDEEKDATLKKITSSLDIDGSKENPHSFSFALKNIINQRGVK